MKKEHTRSLSLLDGTGDTTVTWDEDTDEKMLGIIEERMKQGFVFYILKPVKFLKINSFRKTKAKSIDEVKEAGSVIIKDDDLAKLFVSGDIGVAKTPTDDQMQNMRRAANANDVVENQSVGVRPAKGG